MDILNVTEQIINVNANEDVIDINVVEEVININVDDAVINILSQPGAYPLPSTLFSVFGRVGNVVAQEGDYNLTQLSGVTISSPSNGQILSYNGSQWVNVTPLTGGSVTSVDMSVPVGLQVSGNPITTSGTLAVSLANGYVIPTQAALDAKQDDLNGTGIVKSTAGTISYLTDNTANWDAAYNDKINSASVTGTTTKTLTLNQQDGGTITASWTDDNTDAVSSVFGRTGAVVAANGDYTTSQVTEGSNLYFTNARVHSAISGTAPISEVSGVISIAQSNTTTDGYLSATDWNTFNNKQPLITAGTTGQYYRGDKTFQTLDTLAVPENTNLYYTEARVNANTNVAANTAARHNAVTLGTANGLSLSTQILSLAAAGTSTTGALTSTDWNTFNSKQPLITAGTTAQYYRGDKTFQTLDTLAVAENTNLYYTDARARAAISGTLPISVTSGVVSISQASGSSNGYLSSTDWNTFNNKQAALNGTGFVKSTAGVISYDTNTYLTTISGISAGGELSGTYANPSLVNSAVIGKVLTGLNLTGGGTIAATDSILGAFGKVQNQISALVGGVMYEGTWNASTNTPTIVSSVGSKGDYYIVATAGNTNINGITSWNVGDWIIFNGSTWDKVDNTDAVSSVNGYTGAVNLVTSDIAESGSLYFTNARAIGSTLTGYTSGAGVVAATDTILQAIQKLNGNVSGLVTGVSSVFGRTGAVVAASGDYTTTQVTEGTNLYYTEARVNANANVAANTAARHNAVTIGTANGLSLSTQALSLAAANTTTTGALTSTDWNTFNNKLSTATAASTYVPYTGATGDVTLGSYTLSTPQVKSTSSGGLSINANSGTQVANFGAGGGANITFYGGLNGTSASFSSSVTGSNLSGTNTGDVTIGTANGLSLSLQALSLALASTSATGALSSTDWNTFNGKQAALNGTGFVKISGTTISYDNSTYLTTSAASSTYLPLAGGTLTGALNITNANLNLSNAYYLTARNNANSAYISLIGRNTSDRVIIDADGYGTTIGGGGTLQFNGVSTFSSSVTAANAEFINGGQDGSLGSVVRISTTNANSLSRNWAIVNTWDNYGDLTFRVSNAQGGNALSSGSTKMVILQSGNVGIGTSSPANYGSTYTTLTLNNATTGSYAVFQYGGTSYGQIGAEASNFVLQAIGSADMKFTTNSAERMRILANGNIGIGTSSINGKLQVKSGTNQNLVIGTQGGELSFEVVNDAYSANTPIRYYASTHNWYTGGLLKATLDASGNLGLGVTPSAWNLSGMSTMQIKNASLSGYNNNSYLAANWSYINGDKYIATGAATIFIQDSGAFQWLQAPSGTAGNAISFTQAMTLNASGRLGVGTTSPGALLDVYSTTADATNNPGNSQIRASASSIKWLSIGYDTNINAGYLQGAESGISWRPIILNLNGTTTSPVLIGQSTSDGVSKLQVTGAATFNGAVTISTSSSPGLNISKDASADNRYIRLTNTQASSKSWDLINQTNANNNKFVIYNATDNISTFEILPTGAATFASTITAKTSFNSAGTNSSPVFEDWLTCNPGTTTPTKIQVGNSFSSSAGTWMKFVVNTDTTANTPVDVMTFKYNGFVGIGTASPGYKLQVGDLANTSAVYNDIFVTGDRVNNDGYYARLIFGNSSQSGGSTASIRGERKTSNFGTELTFYTNTSGSAGDGTEKMRITNSGNVGIGFTSTFGKLSVNVDAAAPASSGNMTNGVTIANTTGGRAINIGVNESGAYNYIQSSYVNNADVAVNLAFFTGASEKMRLTNVGDLSIGATTPAYRLEVYNSTADDHIAAVGTTPSIQLMNANTGAAYWGTMGMATTNNNFITGAIAGDLAITNRGSVANNILFGFGTSEKMRIVSDGSVLINTTSNGLSAKLNVNGLGGFGSVYVGSLGTGLVYSSSGTLTSTNPSDERLKDNITDISWGLNDILKLRPVSYHWKDDKINQGVQFGFIAQEVQEVMPEAIKEFGNDVKYLGLEKDAIYATLVKAIQELKAEIEELKLKIK